MKLVSVPVLLGMLALAACTAKEPRPSEALTATEHAKAAVLLKLKDPSSAQWERVWVSGARVCGWVNAKNSFGGYIGARRFYSSGSSTWIDGELPGTQFDDIWSDYCGQADHTVADGGQPGPSANEPTAPNATVAEAERLRARAKQLLAE